MRRVVLLACGLALLLGVLVGCARGEEPGPTSTLGPLQTASSPSAEPTPEDSIACDLLTSKERRSVAGRDLKIVSPAAAPPGIDQCRWVDTLKSAAPSTVQVTAAKAGPWAERNLPSLVDFVLQGGQLDEKGNRKLVSLKKELVRQDDLSNTRGCQMFAELAKAAGRKNVKELVTLGSINGQPSAQAQICSKGIHATVSYAEADLTPTPILGQAVLRLVRVAHGRAVKIGYAD